MHKVIKDFDPSEPYTIAPAHGKTGLLDLVVPADTHDGFIGFFCSSSHHRGRIMRSECVGSIVLYAGCYGSSVFAVRRADKDASIVFRHVQHVERHTFTAEGGYAVETTVDPSKESL